MNRDLYKLINSLNRLSLSGLSIHESLCIILENENGAKQREKINKVIEAVTNGNSLSVSFGEYKVSDYIKNMIMIGEISGNLSLCLENIIDDYNKSKDLNNKILSALFYPMIIGVFSFTLVIFLVAFIVPKITTIFTDLKIDLPIYTKALIFISSFLNKYWIFIGIIFTGFSVCITYYNKKILEKLIPILYKTPLIKDFLSILNAEKFSRIIHLLFSAGIPFSESIGLFSQCNNDYICKEYFIRVRNKIDSGFSISNSFKQTDSISVIPKEMISEIVVAEKSGSIKEVLFSLAEHYKKEIYKILNLIPSLLEPLIMATLGLTVLFIALSIITPIYSISQFIKK